jgi:biopolymer transport protein ExbD
MRTPKYQERGSLEFNMTPMIDVTFQLIIFFLVSSRMAQQESQVEVDLPTARTGVERIDDATRRVTVNVTREGDWLVAGRRLDEPALGAFLAEENEKAAQIEVRIRCDRSVDYGRVKPIMRQCLQADVWKVTFAVVDPEAAN